MQREIKFRAWDVSGDRPCMVGPHSLDDAIFNHKDIRKLPLMQYTGSKDMKGVEVYESDVVKVPYGVGVVVYSGCFAMYMIEWIYDKEANMESLTTLPRTGKLRTELEVIGNVYEHPHLLNTNPSIPAI